MSTAPQRPSPASDSTPWVMQSAPAAETILNGKKYLYFAGTGYLGLQADEALIHAAQQATQEYGIHTATTRGGFGTSPPVQEVERRAAEFLGTEDALYLVSGYAGNFALCAALSGVTDLALIDEHAHDCLREAVRWLERLKRPALTFRHRDPQHVAALLREHLQPHERALLLTDGLFAAGGRLAPLADYLAVLNQHAGAMLLVDDAHGLGVLGAGGRGSLELAGVGGQHINRDLEEAMPPSTRVFCSATLSKAIGGHGGVIAGSRALLDRVRRSSGWFRGSSAPAAPIAAATAQGLAIVAGEPQRRAQLAENVASLRRSLAALGLEVEQSPSPVIGITLESTERMQRVGRRLLDQGIAIGFARDYAGAGPAGMLRIAVFATHTPAMLERLVSALAAALQAETAPE